MPRIWYEKGFSFSFFAADGTEPPHIHVTKQRGRAKWWLDPVEEARSRGFNRAERAAIRALILENRDLFLEAWARFFAPGGA